MNRLLIVFWSTALWAQPEEARNPRATPQDVSAGAKTFRSHCAPCHGLNGEGGRGPNLASGAFFHGGSDAALLQNISDGIPGTEMPGLFYSPDRVWQVIAYLRSLNRPSAKHVGDPAVGAALFRAKGCPQCHRAGGDGGRQGPDLSETARARSPEHLRQSIVDPNADVRQRYWIVSFQAGNGEAQSGFLMNEDTYTVQFMDFQERLHTAAKSDMKDYKVEKTSRMPSYREQLSAVELDHLVAYLWSLRPR
ncbi:MAG: c-type cytochrome [Acidobacteria bacterium]|nr:c-type cytochrome [Acidobacteriota bacterium]